MSHVDANPVLAPIAADYRAMAEKLAALLRVPAERIVIDPNLPPGRMLVGMFAPGPSWEPASPPWPGPYRPILPANVLAAAAAKCAPVALSLHAWINTRLMDALRAEEERAMAETFIVSRPRHNPSTHFTLLEDGTVLDHTPYLTRGGTNR